VSLGSWRARQLASGRGASLAALPSPNLGVMQLDVVLPCLDEAQALPVVLAQLPDGVRAIVVDNGSTDGSIDVARDLGAHVVSQSRRGYGAACHRGLEEATAEFVAFCDCDASFDLADLTRLWDVVAGGGAELVMGRRVAVGSAWPLHARLANRVLSVPISLAAKHRLHDIGPMRLARRQPLLDLDLADRRSGYPLETVLKAARAGWRIRELEVQYRPRIGKSKVTGTVRGTARAIGDMTKVLFTT
jgi:glycosyltransferase involved in cell wall biosynthesis